MFLPQLADDKMDSMANQKNPGYGDFGNLGKQYDEARQGVPDEVIQYFWSLVETPSPVVLDIGCGTGIVTRQLQTSEVKLFGSDKDSEMIKIAKEKGLAEITYVVAPADALPFEDNLFDAIAAFSAFHWFSDKKSVGEIKRVLKPGGIFFVANKNDSSDFKDGYKALLKPFIQGEMPDVKEKYNPAEILKVNGFSDVQEKIFEASEFFTLSQAITYLQSVSVWNLVPNGKKDEAIQAVEDYCKSKLENNFIVRKLNIVAVSGLKNK